jgi:hypothetical protein
MKTILVKSRHEMEYCIQNLKSLVEGKWAYISIYSDKKILDSIETGNSCNF